MGDDHVLAGIYPCSWSSDGCTVNELVVMMVRDILSCCHCGFELPCAYFKDVFSDGVEKIKEERILVLYFPLICLIFQLNKTL